MWNRKSWGRVTGDYRCRQRRIVSHRSEERRARARHVDVAVSVCGTTTDPAVGSVGLHGRGLAAHGRRWFRYVRSAARTSYRGHWREGSAPEAVGKRLLLLGVGTVSRAGYPAHRRQAAAPGGGRGRIARTARQPPAGPASLVGLHVAATRCRGRWQVASPARSAATNGRARHLLTTRLGNFRESAGQSVSGASRAGAAGRGERSGVIQTMRASTRSRPRSGGVFSGIRPMASSAIRNQTCSPSGSSSAPTRGFRSVPGWARAGSGSAGRRASPRAGLRWRSPARRPTRLRVRPRRRRTGPVGGHSPRSGASRPRRGARRFSASRSARPVCRPVRTVLRAIFFHVTYAQR